MGGAERQLTFNAMNCKSVVPTVLGIVQENEAESSERVCRICGYVIHALKSAGPPVWSCAKCKHCSKFAHFKCVDNLFIPRKTFRCSKIKRFLGEGGRELYRKPNAVQIEKKQRPPRLCTLCIICGDNQDSRSLIEIVPCSEKCK
jgi:hypothetical protein